MKYRFLGIEELEWCCELCKKKSIDRAFSFIDMDTGDIVRFGSQCAKKVMGFSTTSKLKKKLRADIEAEFQKKCCDDMMNGIYDKKRTDQYHEEKLKKMDELSRIGL